MDSVERGSGRDLLRRKVAHAQELLQRAAAAAAHGDPVAPQLQAILYTLSTMTDISDDMRGTQTQFQGMLKANTEAIGKITPELAHSSALSITKELGPQLIHAALPTMRQALQTLRLKTLALSTMALVALCVVVGILTYTAGLSAGRNDGEIASQTIQAAMKAGPVAALDWALLMANNNPGPELAACRKNIATDEYGRRSCSMPVWLDPPLTGHP
jgi:hypothetical protein